MRELIIDSFAGGGGASLGIKLATGRCPDIAINHDAAALAMHAANHPETRHVLEDVWKADLRQLVGNRPVGLLWASPDCRHFSRAMGGKPVSKQVRSLAWIVVKWAEQIRPRMICLENVREFADWGPLTADNLPCPERKGLTFKRWIGRLRNLGYVVEYRNLDAADYGTPTHRKRLFLIARRDGKPIQWPDETHCPAKLLEKRGSFEESRHPYRTAAECIDWSIPCPSIFDRKKPLAEKTLRRIAEGIRKYILENPRPFIVGAGGPDYSAKPKSVSDPFTTLTAENHRALVTPIVLPLNHVVKFNFDHDGIPLNEPLPTSTTATHIGLVYSFLVRYFGTAVGQPLSDPLFTVTGKDRFGLITVTINGEQFAIVDIGLRMLMPRELARAQGFPDSYILTGTKTNQVARIGNSVCPPIAAAIVAANWKQEGRRAA